MRQETSTRESRDRAHEVKYLLPAEQAAEILNWIRSRLAPDPYAGGPTGDEYSITTLYFDTEDLAVYRRIGSHQRAKFRVRRYGSSDHAFVERKLRTGKILSKRRTAIPLGDLTRLAEEPVDASWDAAWFATRLALRHLAPVNQVSYRRHARVGTTPAGPIRLTFDTDLTAQPCTRFGFDPPEGQKVLTASTIVEMKFCVEMPPIFGELTSTFGIVPVPISKYRLALEALRDSGMRTGIQQYDLRAVMAALPA